MIKEIKLGDWVAVPVGTVDVIGTVLELYGTEPDLKASVEIPVHGSTGATLDRRTMSYPLSIVRSLRDLDRDELRSHLRRYRPVAAAVAPGMAAPVWDWEPFADVRAELVRRGLTDEEIDELTWGWRPRDD